MHYDDLFGFERLQSYLSKDEAARQCYQKFVQASADYFVRAAQLGHERAVEGTLEARISDPEEKRLFENLQEGAATLNTYLQDRGTGLSVPAGGQALKSYALDVVAQIYDSRKV